MGKHQSSSISIAEQALNRPLFNHPNHSSNFSEQRHSFSPSVKLIFTYIHSDDNKKSCSVKPSGIPRNSKKQRKAISPIYIVTLILWIICGSAYASFSDVNTPGLIGQECSNESSVMSVITSITQDPLSFLGFSQHVSQSTVVTDGNGIEQLFASSPNHQAAQPESIALVALILLVISLFARKTAQKSRV